MCVFGLIKNLWNRLDWRFSIIQMVEVVLLISIYPLMKYAAPQLFEENGVVENLQIIILVVMTILCFTVSDNKMFVLFGLVIIFLIMRETSLGRGYFCAKYLDANEVCQWSKFKYGYLMKGFRIFYALFVIWYFLKNKIWQPIWSYVKNAPIYVWEVCFFVIGAIGGTVAEFPSVDNEIFEESCETLMYVALLFALYRYRKLISTKRGSYLTSAIK